MVKIAVLYCPTIGNIGNEFINMGAEELLKKCFLNIPNAEITNIETLEIGNGSFMYPRDYLSPVDRVIVGEADLIFFIGGSCLAKYYVNIFEDLSKFKGKKFILGASFYEDVKSELELFKSLPNKFDYIFVRDETTWDLLSESGKYNNVINGLDLAFFIDSSKIPRLENRLENVLVNIDSPELGELIDDLYYEHPSSIIVWNIPYKTEVSNSRHAKHNKKLLVAERGDTYLKNIANCKLIYTNRVHTFLTAFLFNTPCEILYGEPREYERYFLYRKIGLEIIRGKRYSEEDYAEPKKILEIEKQRMEETLTNLISNIS